MNIKFYKKDDNRWYTYLSEFIDAGGTEEECEMVCGADVMLEIIAQGDYEVTLNMDINDSSLPNVLRLYEICKNDSFYLEFEDGAYYFLQSYNGIDFDLTIWLCSLTKYVFGNYPQNIYFKKIG